LGIALMGLGDYAGAEPLLVASYDPVAENLGHRSIATRDLADSFVSLYELWGQSERAAEYRRKFDAIAENGTAGDREKSNARQ
jgi:hypothetical protein